jgi:arsenite-transporting ATPase
LAGDKPRIIVFSGKGGVGKTTVAAATGVKTARLGLKTIVISIDIAHSLSDAFDLEVDLQDHNKGDARQVSENLWIQEVDIQEELDRHWGDVSQYLAAIMGSGGMTETLAEELAIIPGMEDVISLLYINQYYKEKTFDVILVDCAPTGETLRFISMPSTLEWYMKKIFTFQRTIMKVARPIAKKVTDIPAPEDSYFAALKDLFNKLEGVDEVLLDREVTSVRLVSNAERMVVRETQRAFMYLCLYGLVVDAVIVNRLFPEEVRDEYFSDWLSTQQRSLEQIRRIFDPIPIKTVNILKDEVVGEKGLSEMGDMIYQDENPSSVLYSDTPYQVKREGDKHILMIKLPFVSKEYVDLFKQDSELVVRIGSFKRHVFLPRALASKTPSKAKMEDDYLKVEFT